jgi:hypothetical protein
MATTAWIVPVWKEIDGLGRTLVAYVAAFESAAEARDAVIKELGGAAGADVREAAAIREETTKALRLARGQVRML